MPKPTYFLLGVPLDDPAGRWRLDGETGRRALPAVRTTAATIPGRHGETYTPGDAIEPSTLALSLTVSDFNEDGQPAGPAQTERNLETLTGLLYYSTSVPLLITHRIGNQDRANYGRIDAAVQPAALNGRLTRYRFPIVLRFPDPFWFDQTSPDMSTRPQDPRTGTVTVQHLTGGSAPVTDSIIRIHTNGVSGRYTITDAINNTGLIWEGSPTTASPYLFLDTATLTARLTSSATAWWGGGGQSVTANLDYPPEGPLQISAPNYLVAYTRPAAFADPEALAVRAYRRYL